jgi:hypothetical protein
MTDSQEPTTITSLESARGGRRWLLRAGNGDLAIAQLAASLEATVNEQFATVTGVTGAAELALMLEEIAAAATYLSAIPQLTDPDVITAAGGIVCVDRQHAAVLRFVLGEYPIPDTFASTDDAYAG